MHSDSISMMLSDTAPVIDVRCEAQFEESHFIRAANIPVEELFVRMHELPDKSRPFWCIVDNQSRLNAESFIAEKSLQILGLIDWPELTSFLHNSSQTIHNDLLQKGKSDCRYWEPTPLVKRLAEFGVSSPMKVVDLACGAGRDAVYLASQGHHVTAIDRSTTALDRCNVTAHAMGLSLSTQQLDLELDDSFEKLKALIESCDLLLVCRYLYRPMLSRLVSLLNPGGWLVYYTFMVGSEKFGSPRNPDYLLKPGELAETFASAEIVHNEVIRLPDGRPMNEFIARSY